MARTESPPEWVFFDCFNTLLLEPDATGLATIEALPVEAGFYPSVAEFRADYAAWVAERWPSPAWEEVLLPERLLEVLLDRDPDREDDAEALVVRMIEVFETEYPKTLEPADGVIEMLEAWHAHAQLAVVSNFFLPDWPESYLEHFGLASYFDFILDSGRLGWKKPGERFFREALRLAQVDPSNEGSVLVVGDHPRNDVQAPLALGMRALHFSPDGPAAEGAPAIRSWHEFRPSGS